MHIDQDSQEPTKKGAGSSPIHQGAGSATGHHGELLQGVFEDNNGRLHRALVTVPLFSMQSMAVFRPGEGSEILVDPSDRIKARSAAEIALQRLNLGGVGGRLSIASDVPIGHGYGSSSADVIASIRAIANAAGVSMPAPLASEIAVEAESASDAIAFEDTAVLFAHREGRALEHFGAGLPPLWLVSCKSAGAVPVKTDNLARARYDAEEIQLLRTALAAIRNGLRQQDPRLLGYGATLSARISQKHLPKEGFEAALAISQTYNACGVQVAHSGTLLGLLVDALDRDARAKSTAIASDLSAAGFIDVDIFAIGTEGKLP